MKIKFLLTPEEIDSLQRGQQIFVSHVRNHYFLLEVELNENDHLIDLGRHMSLDGFHLRLKKERQDW